MLTVHSWSPKASVMILSGICWRGWWEQTSLGDSKCHLEPVCNAAIEEDGTGGLVIEVFDDLDKVGADIVLLQVAHKVACQTFLKAFLRSMKTWFRSCWCWRYFLQRFLGWRSVLWCFSCSWACLFFSIDLLHLQLQPVWYDIQHDFAWMAYEADHSIVLALLRVAFLGKCDDQGVGSRRWPFSCLPDLDADCSESCGYFFSTCLDQFCWDVVNSSWLPFLQWLYCSLHFFVKDGVVILCVSGDSSVLMDLHWLCSCTARSSILSISLVSLVLL